VVILLYIGFFFLFSFFFTNNVGYNNTEILVKPLSLYNIFVVKRETFNTIAYSAAQKKIIKKTQLNLVKPCVLPDLAGKHVFKNYSL